MRRRGSAWSGAWFVLSVCLPSSAETSCENGITVRAPGFEYSFSDVAPYAGQPLGQDAGSDSIFHQRTSRNYDNLARGLAVAAQIYRCMQAKEQVATIVANETGEDLLELWQAPGHDLRRLIPGVSAYEPSPTDELVDLLKRCVDESTTTLYSVQVGSFVDRASAVARLQTLPELAAAMERNRSLGFSRYTSWDSTHIVDWWNWSCGGDQRPDLFILGPDEAPGPGYKVLHGLFVERRDAIAARNRVRQKHSAVVISLPVSGRTLRTALGRP